MKKSITIIIALFIAFGVFLPMRVNAQAPEKLSYQAVIRDANGDLVTDQTVGMRITIMPELSGSLDNYSETQTPVTNSNGLVSIEIGGNDAFSEIDWSDGPYYIKTETDPEGGTNYTITGTSQLLSVPYALHAKNADSLAGNVTAIDYGYKLAITEANELTALFPISPSDSLGSYTILVRTHSVVLGDRYQEWRLIIADDGDVITEQIANIGDLAGTAHFESNHGTVYGEWTSMISDDNFVCSLIWRRESFIQKR